MGPIMQERTASTTLKRVVSKEKIRVKNTENSGPVTSSKKSNKTKKPVGQQKNGLPGPGQDKDTVTAMQRGSQSKAGKLKSVQSTKNASKVSSPEEDGDLRPPHRKHLSAQRKEDKRDAQRPSQCCIELPQNRQGAGKNRRALSLPLSPISGLRQSPALLLSHSLAPTPESLQHYIHKEEDTDSASDLSDSERLPVLPSPCTPCTPPHLNLRAEIINIDDFPPDFPGPHGTVEDDDEDEIEKPKYSYPDFLPPPFNSWSLRQLAVFLHTEGRGAPRPKPVGPLEKYLERLLQLEWLQVQTVQAESSRPPGSRTRPQSFPSAATANPSRPHTAPSSRLNSPKGMRHSQRAFPYTPVNNPPSPASAQHQLSRFPVCPHCHIRYPLCNGSCSSYAYQRHSRLSPLFERRARPGTAAKRSSSETRASSTEGRSPGGQSGGGAQTPVSPSAGKSHLKHMQAAGNVRKHIQEGGTHQNGKSQMRKSRVRANSETDVKNQAGGIKTPVTPVAEKRGFAQVRESWWHLKEKRRTGRGSRQEVRPLKLPLKKLLKSQRLCPKLRLIISRMAKQKMCTLLQSNPHQFTV